MAKIGLTKLGLKPNNEILTVYCNEQPVEVKQYLPVEEKLELITDVLQLSHDQNNYSNPVKVEVYTTLKVIEKYTNVNFTDKQKENPTKTYDLLVGNGFAELVFKAIPEREREELLNGIDRTIKSVYEYQNSVLGILENISQDYSNVKFDVSEIQKQLAETENLKLVKDIVTKLG